MNALFFCAVKKSCKIQGENYNNFLGEDSDFFKKNIYFRAIKNL